MPHAPLKAVRLEAKAGKTQSLVILAHGYGANGDDLFDLAQQWAPDFPFTTFLSVHAPEACPMAPGGLQWFPLTINQGGLRNPDEYWNGVCHAEKALQDFIDKELAHYNIDERSCVLVGFSQGTMMMLHCGLRRLKKLAGIIGYSGVLAGFEKLGETLSSKPPILLVHGAMDPVVPVEALHLSKKAMIEQNIEVEWHINADIGHTIDPLGFLLGQNFLKCVLMN